MAKGKRPAPFRTRKLSPSAPMVLRGRLRGRVGRRRTFLLTGHPSGWPVVFGSRTYGTVVPRGDGPMTSDDGGGLDGRSGRGRRSSPRVSKSGPRDGGALAERPDSNST